MLVAIDTQERITTIPHRPFYDACRANLSDAEYQAIFGELNRRIDSDEVHTSSWIPGEHWEGTVYYPIYSSACNHNQEAAALFFGLILWHVMIERPEFWGFGRYALNNIPIEGLTYFRVHPHA